jgi:CBS domain-containing protein
MRVGQLLKGKAPVITMEPLTPVSTAVRLIMQHGIGGLPVVGPGGRVIGFVAEREIVGALDEHPEPIGALPVEHIMRRPAPVCSADDSLETIMQRLTRERMRHLVVMDGDRILGVVSVGDLVKHRLEQLELEAGVLRDYVAAQRAVD